MIDDYDHWEQEELRKRQNRLLRNPDCRDPAHPGCERCETCETDKEDEDDSEISD